MDLFGRSIEIIQSNQSDTGAYLACPTFPTYRYSWFRDGSYIAYAMDLTGKFESAARFHNWAAETINKKEKIVHRAIAKHQMGESLSEGDFLHTRYTLDGKNSEEDWPNYQLDGFGTWLWALNEHLRQSGSEASLTQKHAAHLVVEYLATLWKEPSSDCWEEFPDHVHPHTLAAIYAGLQAAENLLDSNYELLLTEIIEYILRNNFERGYFVKFTGAPEVDASLVGLATPYKVFRLDDKRIQSTIAHIDATLRAGEGGVHRYSQDTYYGGGEWVVLAGWLGWYYAEAGEIEKATELLGWMEDQANSKGELPEQVPRNLNNASYYEPWRERWGEIAQPLLWSHAKYIILSKVLEASG
jgi:GH15 family glucan-1,4-alpha-glucosidase